MENLNGFLIRYCYNIVARNKGFWTINHNLTYTDRLIKITLVKASIKIKPQKHALIKCKKCAYLYKATIFFNNFLTLGFMIVLLVERMPIWRNILVSIGNLTFKMSWILNSNEHGTRWDVQLELFRQFKSEIFRLLKGFVLRKNVVTI